MDALEFIKSESHAIMTCGPEHKKSGQLTRKLTDRLIRLLGSKQRSGYERRAGTNSSKLSCIWSE